jgi:hypothetical protein
MSVQGPPPSLLFDLNVDQCQAILVKTLDLLPLLYTDRSSSVSRSNLKVLLDKYFQDDALGHCFRSMIVYGQVDGAEVTLDHFNKFVMRPQSSNKFELQPTSSIVPCPIDSAIRVELNKNIFILGYEMVDFVLNFVTLSHPRYSEILFF